MPTINPHNHRSHDFAEDRALHDSAGVFRGFDGACPQLTLELVGGKAVGSQKRRRLPCSPKNLDDTAFLAAILSLGMPNRRAQQEAKRMIDRYGTFACCLSRLEDEVAELDGDVCATLELIRSAVGRFTTTRLLDRDLLGNWGAVLDYCRARLAGLSSESFHVLYLDKRNALISAEEQGKGTVDHCPVYPREVVRRGLILQASALIMVHNHPPAIPRPAGRIST